MGWGGVGMLTFLAHAHMLDALSRKFSHARESSYAGKVRTHAGRFLVAVSRKDKQTAWFPLPDKHTMQNAPGPPETTEEILPIMSRKLDSQKHMVASDSSKGIAAACKALNLPSATARHSLSEFTPVQRVKTKSIAKKCLNALTRRRQKTSAHVGSRNNSGWW